LNYQESWYSYTIFPADASTAQKAARRHKDMTTPPGHLECLAFASWFFICHSDLVLALSGVCIEENTRKFPAGGWSASGGKFKHK
jgi:hypothetical protein